MVQNLNNLQVKEFSLNQNDFNRFEKNSKFDASFELNQNQKTFKDYLNDSKKVEKNDSENIQKTEQKTSYSESDKKSLEKVEKSENSSVQQSEKNENVSDEKIENSENSKKNNISKKIEQKLDNKVFFEFAEKNIQNKEDLNFSQQIDEKELNLQKTKKISLKQKNKTENSEKAEENKSTIQNLEEILDSEDKKIEKTDDVNLNVAEIKVQNEEFIQPENAFTENFENIDSVAEENVKNHKKFAFDKDKKIIVHDLRTESSEAESLKKENKDSKDFVTSVKFQNNQCEMQMDLTQQAKENILSLNNQTASSQGSTFQSMLSNQIQQNAADLVKAGQIVLKDNDVGSIKLILNPESLGNVKIDLQISDKVITGKIIVASQEAYNAFKESADSLKNAFNQNGFETSGFDLSFQGQNANSDGNFQNQQEQKQFMTMYSSYQDVLVNSDEVLFADEKNVNSYKTSINIVA